MTFAELMVLLLVGFLLYIVLKPLRLRIERMLLRLFGRSVRSSGRVIDITPNRKTER
jgi:predicted PurR-regulated permease PerM